MFAAVTLIYYYYLHQVDEVNGEYDVFTPFCRSVCVTSIWYNDVALSLRHPQIALKRLKLRTSNLTCRFTGTVRTWPLNFFSKMWRGHGYMTP